MGRSCWVQIGAGRLTVWHRPKLRSLPTLKESGCDIVVTLLSAKEGGAEFAKAVIDEGMDSIWFPMNDGKPPVGPRKERLLELLPGLIESLYAGKSILIHCSAGIHRTGMLTYALLRHLGYREEQALELIAEMRIETARGLEPKHLAFYE